MSSDHSAICLIRPPAVESFRFATTSITSPPGLAYISAALKAAHFDTHVINAVGEAPEVRTLYTKLNICWQLPTGTRSEAIDPAVARLLKASGITNMAYAPESGSDRTRVFIKKKMTASKLYESIDAATGAGLYVAVFLVIGFPHDRPEHLAEIFPFIDELGKRGVGDVSVGYYMALPGTELFHSFYDAGRIKLDRRYCRHILEALAIVPSQSYSDALRPPRSRLLEVQAVSPLLRRQEAR